MTTGEIQNSSTLSTETLCLQLGWSMQRLYRARPEQEKVTANLPDRLPGLSKLTRLQRVEIDYGRARSCLSEIASGLSWTEAETPDISNIEGCLDVFQKPSGRVQPVATSGDPVKDYRNAVLTAHRSLITKIAAACAPLGKAYVLGRALADTCRPNQDDADVQESFDPYRLAQLLQDLRDLASVLPAHSAKAVGQSLTWWRDVVYLADSSQTGQTRRQLLGSVRTDAPELRRPPGILNPKISTASSSGSLDPIRSALPRQGELWRVVLTGEKDPLDLLTPDDYLNATKRAVNQGRRVAANAITGAPAIAIVLFVVVTAILAGVIVYIEHSQASGGGKLAAFLVAVGGYLGALARAAAPRLRSAAKALEQPLWQAALDYASAECISIPPVGNPDAAGWSKLSGPARSANGSAAANPPGNNGSAGRPAEEKAPRRPSRVPRWPFHDWLVRSCPVASTDGNNYF
jgi:hypothetical protein